MRDDCTTSGTIRITVGSNPVSLDVSLNGLRFMHLDDAVGYLKKIYACQRITLNAMVKARQDKGNGSLFDNTARVKRWCERGIEQHMLVKEFVLLAMNSDNLSGALQKESLIKFGRVIAIGEFILRDTLSLIEQSVAAVKTVSVTEMPSDEAVRQWIDAEHKALGLEN